MGLLVSALGINTPDFVKKSALRQLFNATAAAFEVEVPRLAGLDYKGCLAEYALFTMTQADRRLRDGSGLEAVGERLYRNAFRLGRRYGRWLRHGSVQDVMATGRVLYRILDIDFQGDPEGEVAISHCHFSRFYSGEVCRLMSAMDAGLFAGLSNGGELTFTLRITEGQPFCRARFRLKPVAAPGY
jgi:hypothetical protein